MKRKLGNRVFESKSVFLFFFNKQLSAAINAVERSQLRIGMAAEKELRTN